MNKLEQKMRMDPGSVVWESSKEVLGSEPSGAPPEVVTEAEMEEQITYVKGIAWLGERGEARPTE